MLKILGAALIALAVLLVLTALRHNMIAPEGMSTSGLDTVIIAAIVAVIGVAVFAA